MRNFWQRASKWLRENKAVWIVLVWVLLLDRLTKRLTLEFLAGQDIELLPYLHLNYVQNMKLHLLPYKHRLQFLNLSFTAF